MKQSRVSIGDKDSPTYDFYNDDIIDVEGVLSVSLVGEELAADTLTVTVNYNDTDEELRTLPYGTPVWYYIDMELVGRFFSTNVDRVGKTHYQINCTSVIGILDKEIFYGGIYFGRKLNQVINSIVQTNGITRYRKTEWTGIPKTYQRAWTYPVGDWDFRDSLHYEFNYVGLDEEINDLDTLTYFEVLCGIVSEDFSYYERNYGIAATLTRNSTADQFSDTLSLFFFYKNTRTYVCDISPGDDVVVDIQPANGTATVNGVTVAFTMAGDGTTTTLSFISGIKVVPRPGTGGWIPTHYQSYVNVRAYEGSISSRTGTILANFFPASYAMLDPESSGFFDTVGRTLTAMYEEQLPGTPYTAHGDFVTYDDPFFFTPNSIEEELLSQIEYDEGIADIRVRGHLGVMTKREALHQVLFATGVSLLKNQSGKILFTGLYQYQPEPISSDDIYMGGDIEYLEDTYKVTIKEHSFALGGSFTSEEIYKNSNQAGTGEYIAVFDKSPCYVPSGPTVEGNMTVWAYNENAAIVTGTGTLKAPPYSHAEKVIERIISDNLDGKTIEISDATLITPENVEVVADRLEAYYTAVQKVNNALSITDQKCGRLYSFLSPFRELTSGYLSKIAITKVSAIIKASCEFITGFIPVNPGGGYTKSIVLTGSGTWAVPAEVFEEQTPRIRVFVIGGGSGGYSGFAGEDGESSETGWHVASGGAGGDGGESGLGGKFLEVTITNPDATYSYSCGTGGAGGDICDSHDTNNPGEIGGDTTFGSYSSADGERSDNGISGFGGYASKTYSGKKGAPGGYSEFEGDSIWRYPGGIFPQKGDPGYYNGEFYYGGEIGQNIASSGGAYALGGCGGGAAAGQNGHDGSPATRSGNTYRGGDGGDGADAVSVPSVGSLDYGCGGIGGHGGGGGGCSGTTATGVSGARGTAGKGGKGGKGAKGGNGCVLIYY